MTIGAWSVGAGCLELVRGDITTQAVDAIGNAASTALRGGGGVDGAIHRAAGPGLLEELRRRYPDGTVTGSAVETGGHRLPAGWVIHAVGPVWGGGKQGEAELLAGAYRSCLRLADDLGARSLALPAISMGIYGYPLREGARVAVSTVLEHLQGGTALELVRFVLRADTWEPFVAAAEDLTAG
jgi:O-acetyl-ADP-ribose deacetylase (regulator of RNase III)